MTCNSYAYDVPCEQKKLRNIPSAFFRDKFRLTRVIAQYLLTRVVKKDAYRILLFILSILIPNVTVILLGAP
jgi:hypothetical protein